MSALDVIRHNLWWKVFSLLIAMLIWFAVDKDERTKPEPEVPGRVRKEFKDIRLRLLSAPGNHSGLVLVPAAVTVALSGPGPVIERLDEADLIAFVRWDSSSPAPGLQPVEVRVPAGVLVVGVIPHEVSIENPPRPGETRSPSN